MRITKHFNDRRNRLFKSINADIFKIVQWDKEISKVNSKKTQVTYIFKLKSNKYTIKLNIVEFKDVDRLRIVEVYISSNLKWNQYINNIANKATR